MRDPGPESEIAAAIQAQYNRFPYPAPSTALDAYAPVPSQFSALLFPEHIRHYGYAGKNPFNRGFRILVAGCGIGTDVINLAYLFRQHRSVSIRAIDISDTALRICQKRLDLYGIRHVELRNQCLLTLDPAADGGFDLIVCSGVLHHLEHPREGLRALVAALRPGGLLHAMVYATEGRASLSQIRDLMTEADWHTRSLEQRVEAFKALYAALPETHPFRRIPQGDLQSDNGIVDFVLNAHDCSFTCKEFDAFLGDAGLSPVCFDLPSRLKQTASIPGIDHIPYDSPARRQISALFHGDVMSHVCLAGVRPSVPACSDTSLVPTLTFLTEQGMKEFIRFGMNNPQDSAIFLSCWAYQVSSFLNWSLPAERANSISIRVTPLSLRACALIDGERSSENIIERLVDASPDARGDVAREFLCTLADMVRYELVLLMDNSSDDPSFGEQHSSESMGA